MTLESSQTMTIYRGTITIEEANREATNLRFATDLERIGSHFVDRSSGLMSRQEQVLRCTVQRWKGNDEQGNLECEDGERCGKVTRHKSKRVSDT